MLFLENIEVCAKAHGQRWYGRLQVTLWPAYLNDTLVKPPCLWLSGSASQASDQRWHRPRVHPLPALSALPDSEPRKRLILISFINHLAFRMKCALEGELYECPLNLKLIELSYWRSLISLKSK